MSNVIDFNKHKEMKEENDFQKRIPNLHGPNIKFDYKFLADYEERELYINVAFNDFDINVDVGDKFSYCSSISFYQSHDTIK